MLRPSDEERLSAYFDEELSSEERADAECLLREDPAARDWLDQLEDLHAELQLLPHVRLPGDFADGVLRWAEREMLLADGAHERPSLEPDAAHSQNGAAGYNGVAIPLAAVPLAAGATVPFPLTAPVMESGSASHQPACHQPSCGERADRELRPTLSQLPGELSRQTAESPSVAARAARPGSDPAARWNAPSWLAAAASLLLFAGVLALGTSEHNWAKTGSPSPGERTALSNTAQSNATQSRTTQSRTTQSNTTQRRPDRRDKAGPGLRSEGIAGRIVAHSKSDRSAGQGIVPPADGAEQPTGTSASRTSASRTYGGDLGAEHAAEKLPALPREGSVGGVARSKGSASLPEADEAFGDDDKYKKLAGAKAEDLTRRWTEGANTAPRDDAAPRYAAPGNTSPKGVAPQYAAPSTGAAPAPLPGVPAGAGGGGSGGPTGPAAGFAKVPPGSSKSDYTSPAPPTGGGETFAFFSALSVNRAAANGPANNGLANVVVVDVDGAPAEAFARIEQALLLRREIADAKDQLAGEGRSAPAKPTNAAPATHAAQTMSTIRLRDVFDKEALDQTASGRRPTEKGTDKGKEKGEENRTALFDAAPARVYFVDLPPEELARTLRDVAVVARGKGDVAVTNLGTLAEPLPEGAASLELGEWSRRRDARLREAPGGPGGGPRIEAESEEQRRELVDPIAVDKKSLLKSAEQPSERKKKREQDSPARQDPSQPEPSRPEPSRTAPGASAKFAAPAPTKLAAGKEALRFADDSPAQPAMSLIAPASPRTGTPVPTMRVPTIIVVRVNPPSRPGAPAPASPSR